MSGYPLRSVHDATKKRQKYVQELALRARLDDVNLQANKMYKRTGAISALPDTRTTTEKLADLYRLRIDIYSKLTPIMSGDDAQKVINGLDVNEIRFLSQRIDKIVQYLKPKYKQGVPYQVFNDYLAKSMEAMNTLGDDNVANLALVENMVSKEDFNSALTTMMQQYSTAEQNKLRGAIRFYEGLTNEIRQAQRLVSSQILDAQSQNDLTQLIGNLSGRIPNNDDIDNLLVEYQTAVSYADTQAINNLKLKIDSLVADIASLENDKRDLEQGLNDAIRANQIAQVDYSLNVPPEQQTVSQTPAQTIYKTVGPYTYIPPADVMDKSKWPRTSSTYADLSGYLLETRSLMPDKQLWANKGGVSLNTMTTNWSAGKLRQWIVDNDDLFKQAWTDISISAIPPVLPPRIPTPQVTPIPSIPSTGVSTPISLPSTGTPTPPILAPPPPVLPPLPNQLTIEMIAQEVGSSKTDLNNLIASVKIDLTSAGVLNSSGTPITKKDITKQIYSLPSTPTYQNSVKSITEISAYIVDWINNLRREPLVTLEDYIDDRVISGTGMRKSSKSSKKTKMKGKGISIDFDAGIQSNSVKPSSYVPFGKFIINRKKLADGIVMIKRIDGRFMGDIQSKRVSSKLKNVFDKIVGGNVPSFSDYDKLDDDEREYLKYVSSKANLEDKLAVPAPKKDTDEQLINKFEVYRGQLCAGQDNKEMIEEFKKLLVVLCDKKLLPRRQVSDILIDLARFY